MKHITNNQNFGRCVALAVTFATLGTGADTSTAERVRSLNNDLLRLHGSTRETGRKQIQAKSAVDVALRMQAASMLKERAAALGQLIEENPQQALSMTFSPDLVADVAAQFPESAAWLERHGTWQGPVERWTYDNADLKSSRTITRMKVGEQPLEIYFASPEPAELTSGSMLQGTGMQIGNKAVLNAATVQGISATAQMCSNTGVQNTAVLLVTFPGVALPSNTTTQSVHDMFFSTTGPSLDGYWRETSYGQTSAAGNVFGPYTLDPSYANCGRLDLLRDAAITAANNAGVSIQSYSRIFIVHADFGCGWTGLAINGCTTLNSPTGSFTASASFLDASWQRSQSEGAQNAAHEGGHNMGLAHAQSRTFGTEPLGPLGAAGTLTEYGDALSDMASSNIGHYAAPHKAEILNWMSGGTNYQIVQNSGAWTLQPAEVSPAGLVALKVQRGTGNNAWLWVEYRQPIGIYDSTVWPSSGALIHYEDSSTGSHTQLLDFTPGTASVYDSALMPGNSWVDPYTNLSITVQSATANALTVGVNYGTTPCTHANPTVSVSPLNPTISAGSSTNYTLSVTNNDSSGCAAGTFTLTSSQPSGWTSTFSVLPPALNPGQTGTATMTEMAPAGATPGTYAVGVRAANGSFAGSGNANCTVVAPSTTLTNSLALPASTYNIRQTVSMTARVMSGGAPAAGASVTFTMTKANGSKATGKATADSSGKASWSYKLGPKDPTGPYSAVAQAASGSQTVSSNSVTFTVQ